MTRPLAVELLPNPSPPNRSQMDIFELISCATLRRTNRQDCTTMVTAVNQMNRCQGGKNAGIVIVSGWIATIRNIVDALLLTNRSGVVSPAEKKARCRWAVRTLIKLYVGPVASL